MVFSADDRFPLSFYYRIANQMVKQAKVYRDEGNSDDLYLTLNRYSRLVSEIIPQHRSYSKYSSKEKLRHEKILREFVIEIEKLRPLFGREDNEIGEQTPRRPTLQGGFHSTSRRLNEEDQAFASYNEGKVNCCSTFRKEGCNVESSATIEDTELAYGNAVDTRTDCTRFEAPFPVALTAARDHDINVHVVRHFFPSPVLYCTESLPVVGHVSHLTIPESRSEYLESSCEQSSASNTVQDVHISARLMEEFMEHARANTNKDLETCGVLGASLKNRTFYVTTLILPKQESTSSSCQALNEEEIYTIQDEQSLFPVGWIHTHPSQTCFLSSIDLHTQYSYQNLRGCLVRGTVVPLNPLPEEVMLPEAVAIVMAPTDPTRSYGIFRLTDPGGMRVLRHCQEKGFHPHPETADGDPIYGACSNVYINPNLRFEIIDLRFPSP